MSSLSKQEKLEERTLRSLSKIFAKRGITVRREKLVRGNAFRAKSGSCALSGERLLFVDRRLPLKQQSSFLIDRLLDYKVRLDDSELELLPERCRGLFRQFLDEDINPEPSAEIPLEQTESAQ